MTLDIQNQMLNNTSLPNNSIKMTPRELANLIGNNTSLKISPEQLSQILGNNATLNITPEQLAKIIGNNSTLSGDLNNTSSQNATLKISPEQLTEMMRNSTMNLTPAELEKMLKDNGTFGITPEQLQEFLGQNKTGDFNASLAFSPEDMANLTSALMKLNANGTLASNQTNLNSILLHVICTVKTGDLSKLFENMAIPLSSCQIR